MALSFNSYTHFFTFIILFTFIFYLDSTYEVPKYNISDIKISNLNDNILIEGTVIKQKIIKEHTFLTIQGKNSQIKGIVFYGKISFQKNRKYAFKGKITINKNNPEIIISEIYEN